MEDQPNLHRLAFKYLMEHMPAPSFPNRFGHPNMFCWERGNMEVRVDWLKKQIDSLDD